jgi:hypothetical protein
MKLDMREYIHAIRNKNCNSGYSNSTINTGHTYGTILDNMGIVKKSKAIPVTGREGP